MSTPEWIRHIREKCGHDLLMGVGVCAVIMDQNQRVLMQRRADIQKWTIPGGFVDPEESVIDALHREVKEETGLDVRIIRVSGIYSKRPVVTYPNGDKVCDVVISFLCEMEPGELHADQDETSGLDFFAVNDLPKDTVSWCIPWIKHATQRTDLVVE